MGLIQYGPVLRIAIVYAFFPQDSEKTDSYIAALSSKYEKNRISISIAPRNNNLNNKACDLCEEICVHVDINRMPILVSL